MFDCVTNLFLVLRMAITHLAFGRPIRTKTAGGESSPTLKKHFGQRIRALNNFAERVCRQCREFIG
jgi:hypothetical protein